MVKKKVSRSRGEEGVAVATPEDEETTEIEITEVEQLAVVKFSAGSVNEIMDNIYLGAMENTATHYIRRDTSETVCIETAMAGETDVIYLIDPSEWADELANSLYDNLVGEGQDPQTVNPSVEGYEYIIKS